MIQDRGIANEKAYPNVMQPFKDFWFLRLANSSKAGACVSIQSPNEAQRRPSSIPVRPHIWWRKVTQWTFLVTSFNTHFCMIEIWFGWRACILLHRAGWQGLTLVVLKFYSTAISNSVSQILSKIIVWLWGWTYIWRFIISWLILLSTPSQTYWTKIS